jgi:hypothetical protein
MHAADPDAADHAADPDAYAEPAAEELATLDRADLTDGYNARGLIANASLAMHATRQRDYEQGRSEPTSCGMWLEPFPGGRVSLSGGSVTT